MAHDTSEKVFEKVWVKITATVVGIITIITGTIYVKDYLSAPVDAVTARVDRIEPSITQLTSDISDLKKQSLQTSKDVAWIKGALEGVNIKPKTLTSKTLEISTPFLPVSETQ